MGKRQSTTITSAGLLEAYTPVERSVLAELYPESRRAHADDLRRRLAIAGEIAAPGAGGAHVERALDHEDVATAVREIDAVLAFGRPYLSLDAAERDRAGRGEIREEVKHFDRIMDLDFLIEGRHDLKRRRDFVHHDGRLGAAERLFSLVSERKLIRLDRRDGWADLGAEPQHLIVRHDRHATLHRTQPPHLYVLVAGADADTCERTVLAVERSALKHPLDVALGLADYELFLEGVDGASIAATVIRLVDGDTVEATVVAAGGVSILDGWSEGFRQIAGTPQVLAGSRGPVSRYAALSVRMKPDHWLVMVMDDGAFARRCNLQADLDRRNGADRIELVPNVAVAAEGRPHVIGKSRVAKAHAARAARDREQLDTATVLDGLVASVEARSPSTLFVSLECGHVHADREVGPAQVRGLELGVKVARGLSPLLGERGITMELDVVPMVDDDHVSNRLAFSDYRQRFERAGLAVDDLIMESSPILRAVAHDVLRRSLIRQGQGYDLRVLGGNLYLESGGLRLELVEDLHGKMRNGCVMFEVGLVVYRLARPAVTAAFWREVGHPPQPIHRTMEKEYERRSLVAGRESIRSDVASLFVDPWEEVERTADRTPYLDLYDAQLAANGSQHRYACVLNVLEDYYLPQQVKVVQLARLLGIALPLEAVFFSPYGDGLRTLSDELGTRRIAAVPAGDRP